MLPQLFVRVSLSGGGVEKAKNDGHDSLDVVSEPMASVAAHRPHGLDVGAGADQVLALLNLCQVSQQTVHNLGVEGRVTADHQVTKGENRALPDGRTRRTQLNTIKSISMTTCV